MASTARIVATSLGCAALAVLLGSAFFGKTPDWTGVAFILACVGAVVGAIAGSGREIAASRRPQA